MKGVNFETKTKVWSGIKYMPIYNSNISLGYLILNVLKKTPERVTQVSADTNVEVTCHEMRMRTMKIAKHLMSSGFKQGDVVGVMASNSEHLAPVVFACLALGLPLNFLSPVMTESDIIHMFDKLKPKIIFCDSNIVGTMKKSVEVMKINSLIYTFIENIEEYQFVDDILRTVDAENELVFPELKDISSSTAIILCSSGTTGSPKGVCKSHAQLIQHQFPMWNLKSKDQEVLFSFSTLYWATGLIYLLTGTLYGAKRVITTKTFDPDLLIEIIDHFKVTTFFSPPSAVALLIHSKFLRPLKSLEIFMVGGSVVSKNLCESIRPFIPNGNIFPVYGTSEGDFLADSFNFNRFGSVGKPTMNVQIKIINEDEKNLGPNEEGEICYKTPVTFSGYFGDPEKSKESVKNDWVYSGDIGYFDDEGFLFIIDRKKDMLKFNNFQVYPSELESIINEIDGVISSCVVGVLEEDKGNDLVYAFVIKDPLKCQLNENEIVTYVNSKVIHAKHLRGGVHFVDNLPMTPSGKIQSRNVRKIAQEIYERNNRKTNS